MRSSLSPARLVALATFTLVSFTAPLFSHGGSYRGPTDTVPPNLHGDGNPGDTPGPGTNPGQGGPATPGNKQGPATGGNGPPIGPPGAGPRGGAIGGVHSRNNQTGGFDQWEFWWENNDDPFLALKARMRNALVKSQASGLLGHRQALETGRRPTASDVMDTIVPALLAVVDSKEADLADSAVLALARIVPIEHADAVLPAIRKTLAHDAKSAREAATLALGVLGAPEAVADLRTLLLDLPEGRRATNHPDGVEPQVRAFAAAALGLIGVPQSAADLERVVRDPKVGATDDLKAVALLALGMVRGGHEEIVPFLQDALADTRLPQLVRAQAPIALARIAAQPDGMGAARAALHASLARFLDEKSTDVKRSLAVALGRIANPGDVEVLDGLTDAVERATDTTTRDFALIALAEIGARDDDVAHHEPAHKRLEQLFTLTLDRPEHAVDRPFGAIALAIWARNANLERRFLDGARDAIAARFEKENNPSFKGAMAVSLGLLGSLDHGDLLAAQFEESRDPSFRGYAAIGIGLMLDRRHSDALLGAIDGKGLAPKFKLQLARALGLLGDPKAVATLLTQFKEATTLGEQTATVEAVGLIGDRDAIAPLIALVRDTSETGIRRGLAAVGLGLLAEKSELPWNAVFTVDSNYRAKTAALAEIFDIL
jgi:HEAT repeat protein